MSLPDLITHRAKNMCNFEDAADLRKLMACAKLPKLQQGCNGKGKYLCDYMRKDPRNAFVVLVGEHEHTYDKDVLKAASEYDVSYILGPPKQVPTYSDYHSFAEPLLDVVNVYSAGGGSISGHPEQAQGPFLRIIPTF